MSSPTREQSWRYERLNPHGFLVRVYRNMWSRVVGIQRREAHNYEGLPILPKMVFYCWAEMPDSAFWPLWDTWHLSGRSYRLTPSIDRKDATRGYTLDNMQWLTHAENSGKVRPERRNLHPARGTAHGQAKLTDADVVHMRQRHLAGTSFRQLGEDFGVNKSTVARACTTGWTHISQEPR